MRGASAGVMLASADSLLQVARGGRVAAAVGSRVVLMGERTGLVPIVRPVNMEFSCKMKSFFRSYENL